MAIDMSTENSSLSASPRISFSHDLRQRDEPSTVEDTQFRRDSTLMEMDTDEFDFSMSNLIEAETTSAEELFSGGLIRPVQIQEKFVHPSKKQVSLFSNQPQQPQLPSLSLPPLPLAHPTSISKEPILGNTDSEQKNHSKSFWRIKRSNSLHGENSHKKSSFWSLPLLSRSNSTGSAPNPKQSLKENQKQNNGCSKQQKNLSGMSQKPPLRKNYSGLNPNGVMRISPVLNMPVPSSTISKGTANLLGLFRNGREKKIKKSS